VKLKGCYTMNRTMNHFFDDERRSAFFGVIVFNEQQIALVGHSQQTDIPELVTGGVFEGGANNLLWKFLFHGFIYAER